MMFQRKSQQKHINKSYSVCILVLLVFIPLFCLCIAVCLCQVVYH